MLNFESKSIEVFKYQYNNNLVYKSFCDSINIKIENIDCIEKIPFLPISLFKSNIHTDNIKSVNRLIKF